jgi:hypothetical protein
MLRGMALSRRLFPCVPSQHLKDDRWNGWSPSDHELCHHTDDVTQHLKDDRWNGYNRQGSLDLSLLILDHFAYTGEVNPELLTIPVEVIEFYGNLWGDTKKNGTSDTMVFFPTQVLETWQCPGWPVITVCSRQLFSLEA